MILTPHSKFKWKYGYIGIYTSCKLNALCYIIYSKFLYTIIKAMLKIKGLSYFILSNT